MEVSYKSQKIIGIEKKKNLENAVWSHCCNGFWNLFTLETEYVDVNSWLPAGK